MADRACVRFDSNASCVQYATPTPWPSIGTPTPAPTPGRLAETGFDLGLVVPLGLVLAICGAAGLTLTGEWLRVWRENRARVG